MICSEWVVLKVKHRLVDDHYYRLFMSERGGYLYGDSWRLNSGIVQVEEDKNCYFIHGSSGSCYTVHKDGYGIRSMYNQGVLSDICSRYDVELLEEMPDMMTLVKDEDEE